MTTRFWMDFFAVFQNSSAQEGVKKVASKAADEQAIPHTAGKSRRDMTEASIQQTCPRYFHTLFNAAGEGT
ncbi:hypothetical protein [Endozoicomonas sp. 2B-B]